MIRFKRKTFSGIRDRNKAMRRSETNLVRCLRETVLPQVSPDIASQRLGETAWELEHFLSRIATSAFGLWCDGVQDLNVIRRPGRRFVITGYAWLGPSDNVASGCELFPIKGSLDLAPSRNRLQAYSFVLEHDGRKAL